jgi:hypothetical protein
MLEKSMQKQEKWSPKGTEKGIKMEENQSKIYVEKRLKKRGWS